MAKVDIIIASCGRSDKHRQMTQNAINSCINSEEAGFFNIIVVESCQNIQYKHCKTIFFKEKEFNYHRAMNQGLLASDSQYACICNNDLIFYKDWASNILLAFEQHGYISASPMSDRFHDLKLMSNKAAPGYTVGKYITGWCIFFDRKVLDTIKRSNNELLDERVEFYYSDNIYKDHLVKHKIKHVLVMNSRVDHLESGGATWKSIQKSCEKRRLTDLQRNKYNNALKNL